MQKESWMRPALQPNEALLLPALPPDDVFQSILPAEQPEGQTPKGSMAGRAVLRAAGIRREPCTRRKRRPVPRRSLA